ncbi:AraC-like DNA-binding protein [Pullulanibacillus pueri]|uniref:AraC family transcriptional regulator n=1 Tax=Pullulanibacillus pueri TaxID=1437324 RepID=A0A8J2ZQM1_9BACL|nr:AraC family transcriptional regulator [Pullulanibacillus pueri]MBM7679911.1 AraC-like DNA-binding protein [Pullulanibacillus pueri]GGH73451.1 AraC family transcriptional regulator [Pullulanibacillus pueri]
MNMGNLKEQTVMPDQAFPINIFFTHDFPLHWHDHIEWIFVKEGKCQVQIDANFVELDQGELAFINSKQLHGTASLEPNTELVCIVFNETLVRGNGLDFTDYHYFLPYLDQRMTWPRTMKKKAPYINEINQAFARLLEEFTEKKRGYELLVKAELLRIFGLFFRFALEVIDRSITYTQKGYDFSKLLQTLRQRYDEAFTINDAAKIVNLSPNHFCRTFKKVTGKTFIEYLNLLRINEAERMLIETNESITEIARKVGFSDINYFGRTFKKIKNMTPSSIRKVKKELY